MPDDETSIEDLQNLGSASAHWLHEIGIATRSDLERIGAVSAYKIVKSKPQRVSLNLLYAMHGALTGQRWDQLSAAEKERLQAEVAEE